MKKREKKLMLGKETLRTLAAQDLIDAHGGTVSGAFTTGCESRIQACFSPPSGG